MAPRRGRRQPGEAHLLPLETGERREKPHPQARRGQGVVEHGVVGAMDDARAEAGGAAGVLEHGGELRSRQAGDPGAVTERAQLDRLAGGVPSGQDQHQGLAHQWALLEPADGPGLDVVVALGHQDVQLARAQQGYAVLRLVLVDRAG